MDISHEIFIVGRSNAINIAERLGLPSVVIDAARKLYGSSSAEIDEVFLIYHNWVCYLLTVVYYNFLNIHFNTSQFFQHPLTLFTFNVGNYRYGEVKTRLPTAIN